MVGVGNWMGGDGDDGLLRRIRGRSGEKPPRNRYAHALWF